MLINREVILAKVEATYNTDALPAATDAILVGNPSWANDSLRMIDRPAVRANIGKLQQIYGGRLLTVTFDVELKGSGTGGTAPEIDALMRACGFGAFTDVLVTKNIYEPVSTGHESATIYYYQDGTLFKLTGCRGNVAFNLETGSVGKASFTLTGHVSALTDAALVTPTYDSTVPPPVLDAAFSIDSFAAVINALTFDMSNTMAMPPDISATDGFGEIQITQRDVNGSIDPQHQLVATEDFIGNFTSGASMALASGIIGSTAGNRYSIDMPAVYYRDASPGDRDGVRTLELPFGATESSGDDEVSIVFS